MELVKNVSIFIKFILSLSHSFFLYCFFFSFCLSTFCFLPHMLFLSLSTSLFLAFVSLFLFYSLSCFFLFPFFLTFLLPFLPFAFPFLSVSFLFYSFFFVFPTFILSFFFYSHSVSVSKFLEFKKITKQIVNQKATTPKTKTKGLDQIKYFLSYCNWKFF